MGGEGKLVLPFCRNLASLVVVDVCGMSVLHVVDSREATTVVKCQIHAAGLTPLLQGHIRTSSKCPVRYDDRRISSHP